MRTAIRSWKAALVAAAVAAIAVTIAGACISVGPSGGAAEPDGSVGGDATAGEGGPPGDAGGDARKGDGGSGGPDSGGMDAAITYHDLKDAGAWQSFDLATINAQAGGFFGAVFDGQYLYLVPYTNSFLVRYDTQAPLDVTDSYRMLDLTTVAKPGTQFGGATFDGRYIYLVPYGSGVLFRLDTQQPFGAGIDAVDLTAVLGDTRAQGFAGAAIDQAGGYIYFAPYSNAKSTYDGFVVRYAFAKALDAGSSYDTSEQSKAAAGFNGAAFDGRYVYYVPYYAGGSGSAMDDCVNCCCMTASWDTYASVALRYDTHISLATPGAFSTVDLRSVNPSAEGFVGAIYDGQRYLYYLPLSTDGSGSCGCCSCSSTPYGAGSMLVRFDTQGSYGAADGGAYAVVDTTKVDGGPSSIQGGAFDGRFIYLAPGRGTVTARFDSQGPFAAASLETFDVAQLKPKPGPFASAGFDGRYVYFVPYPGSVLVRFDARTPPSSYTGSFF